MVKIKIPLGKWDTRNEYDTKYDQPTIVIETDSNSGFITIWSGADSISDENIDLGNIICDAGNTYQQCETLPSELLRQNREMKEALERIKKLTNLDDDKTVVNICVDCLTSCNKGKE